MQEPEEEPEPVVPDLFRWISQLAERFGRPNAYQRRPGQLAEARSEDEQARRLGAAERKRQRRRQRNLRSVQTSMVGVLELPDNAIQVGEQEWFVPGGEASEPEPGDWPEGWTDVGVTDFPTVSLRKRS